MDEEAAEAEVAAPATVERDPKTGRRIISRRRYLFTRSLGGLLGLLVVAMLALLLLDTQIGHRLVIDRIADLSPKSGLKIEIGRIEGSLYNEVLLRDVVLKDPEGTFLTVPEVELAWRPFVWLQSGLDIRALELRRGTLLRKPRLRPGDPDSPVLPSFDVRIERFAIQGLTISPNVIGSERRVNLIARANIRSGRLLVDVDGDLGGADRLQVLVDANPDADRFDINLDYSAPRGGLLAGLLGTQGAMRARANGKGKWSQWDGALLVERDGRRLAAFQLGNRAGRFTALGQAWPETVLSGALKTAVGPVLSVRFAGTGKDSVIDGKLTLAGQAFRTNAGGKVDLASNRFDGLVTKTAIVRPDLLLKDPSLEGVRLTATLDGPFSAVRARHVLTVDSLKSGSITARNLRQTGEATYAARRLTVPLDLTAQSVSTGSAALDPRFAGGHVGGTLALQGNALTSDNLAIDLRGLAARLALRGDLAKGAFALAGPVTARGFVAPNLGAVDANAKIVFSLARGAPWQLRANVAGRMTRIDNATLASLTGGNVRFNGGIVTGRGQPLLFRETRLTSEKLALTVDGQRLPGGRTSLRGSGRHTQYGAFTVEGAVDADGPDAVLVFADPWPPGGLKDVRVALAPIAGGFRIDTEGASLLGPFAGTVDLFAPAGGPTRLAIERLKVSDTGVSGDLRIAGGAITGELALAGGGLNGTVKITPQGDGQRIAALIDASNAKFQGSGGISIAKGRLEATGLLAQGRSTMAANLSADGVTLGKVFIGRLTAKADLVNGSGDVSASILGRRGSRFALAGSGTITPGRIVAAAQGEFAGRRISMPRRAVLTRADEGWNLAPTQIGFGSGVVIASGRMFGPVTDLELKMDKMPLAAGDIAIADLGLGGQASGIVTYRNARGEMPTGNAQLMIDGLVRSGLVLTSRPVDLALVAQLTTTRLETRAVIKEAGSTRGRLQARISGLPQSGNLGVRLRAGSLLGQLRYDGPAEALWRLVGVEIFDLTGPLAVAADLTGTLDDPRVRGSLASDSLRVRSPVTGTDVTGVKARGTFDGSRLFITQLSGATKGDGSVSGSGVIDLTGLGPKGPGIDVKIAARNALLVDRDNMAATVTGPLRIVSSGVGGTIAGRVAVSKGRWQLGQELGPNALPTIPVREINLRADSGPARRTGTPWRYLIDARAARGVDVRGLGLDSEWSADVKLRGTTAAPIIQGGAELVRGGYEFAGKRFELTRGRITFTGSSPPDPQLDIVAEDDVDGISARIAITGPSSRPDVAFSSVPALPDEELLSRILFGSSITNISAVEAVQLAAAVAALNGGEGLDPINQLRSAIGLDRLRVIGADATQGRGTSLAVGKYLGRRVFVEIVTDGQGYSATQLEYRITRWLALLGSISTVSDRSINLKISKDY